MHAYTQTDGSIPGETRQDKPVAGFPPVKEEEGIFIAAVAAVLLLQGSLLFLVNWDGKKGMGRRGQKRLARCLYHPPPPSHPLFVLFLEPDTDAGSDEKRVPSRGFGQGDDHAPHV